MVRCFKLLQYRRISFSELSLKWKDENYVYLSMQPVISDVMFDDEKLSTDKYTQPCDRYLTEASVN